MPPKPLFHFLYALTFVQVNRGDLLVHLRGVLTPLKNLDVLAVLLHVIAFKLLVRQRISSTLQSVFCHLRTPLASQPTSKVMQRQLRKW